MKIFFITLFVFELFNATCQSSIELGFFGRYDKYNQYSLRYFNRVSTDKITLSGISYGANFNYIQSILKYVKINIGVGYDRVGISNIEDKNNEFLHSSKNRPLDYRHPSGIYLGFSTSHYNYNNVSFSGGVSFDVKIDTFAFLTFGADVNYKYTITQQYHINYHGGFNGRTTESRPLGFGVNTCIGVLQQFRNKKYYINPKVIIPIYTMIYGDSIFSESEDMEIAKHFNGIGISIAIGEYIFK